MVSWRVDILGSALSKGVLVQLSFADTYARIRCRPNVFALPTLAMVLTSRG